MHTASSGDGILVYSLGRCVDNNACDQCNAQKCIVVKDDQKDRDYNGLQGMQRDHLRSQSGKDANLP